MSGILRPISSNVNKNKYIISKKTLNMSGE